MGLYCKIWRDYPISFEDLLAAEELSTPAIRFLEWFDFDLNNGFRRRYGIDNDDI